MTEWPWPATVILAAALAWAFAGLLRWSGWRRPLVAGGMIAGLLLGPTVLGRAWPEAHDAIVAGGVEAREALSELRRRQAADRAALTATGVSEAAFEELAARHSGETAAVEDELNETTAARRRAMGAVAAGLAMALLGFVAPMRLVRRDVGANLFVLAWAHVLSGGTLAVFTAMALDISAAAAVAFGLAFVATAPPTSRPIRNSVDGSLATLAAIGAAAAIVAAVAAWWIGHGVLSQTAGPTPLYGLIAGTAIWIGIERFGALRLARLTPWLLVPPAVATALVHVDALRAEIIGPLLIGLIVGGDARWVGLASGLRLGVGMPWTPALFRTLILADAGAIQAAMGVILWASELLPGFLLVGVLVGAVASDAIAPWRGRLLAQMSAPPARDE